MFKCFETFFFNRWKKLLSFQRHNVLWKAPNYSLNKQLYNTHSIIHDHEFDIIFLFFTRLFRDSNLFSITIIRIYEFTFTSTIILDRRKLSISASYVTDHNKIEREERREKSYEKVTHSIIHEFDRNNIFILHTIDNYFESIRDHSYSNI